MTTPLPKRFGYKLPLEALGGACVRVSLEFPDKLEYRAAFNGSINMLGKWFQWDHTQADYQDIPELNVEVAQVWSEVLADALWETCMDFCAQMIANAECFLDDASVQTEIINHLLNNQTFIQAINQIAGKGVPMPLPEIEAPVTDTCVEDNLFGGVTSIIRQMNTNNTDFFEKIEAGTNPIERAALIVSAIPIIETLPVDEIVEFTDQIIENIFENYDAEYTTALEDEYRCDIFCLALEAPDCSVTFDMLFEYFSGRLGGAITIESILAEGIAFVAAGTWSGTEIVDAMMLAQVVLWRAASNFLGINIRTLQTVGLLGQNNPDHDWSILCECVPPPPTDCLDFTISDYDFYPGNNVGTPTTAFGHYDPGVGLAPDSSSPFYFYWWRPATGSIDMVNSVTFTFNQATPKFRFSRGSGGIVLEYDGAAVTSVTFDASTDPGVFPLDLNEAYVFTFDLFNAPNGTIRVIEFCKEPV